MNKNDIEFVFFHVGTDLLLPRFLVNSIKRTNPESTITQLTDMTSPRLPETDRIFRYAIGHKAMMMARAEAYANLNPSGAMRIFLDTDMLVVNEINSDTFKDRADIYLCRRHFNKESLVNVNFRGMGMTEYSGKTLDTAWPYLGCFLATRNDYCLKEVYHSMKEMIPKYQNWYGDQIALRGLADRQDIKVSALSENHFGHLCDNVKSAIEGVRDDTIKVLHFKGSRKEKIGLFYDSIFN